MRLSLATVSQAPRLVVRFRPGLINWCGPCWVADVWVKLALLYIVAVYVGVDKWSHPTAIPLCNLVISPNTGRPTNKNINLFFLIKNLTAWTFFRWGVHLSPYTRDKSRNQEYSLLYWFETWIIFFKYLGLFNTYQQPCDVSAWNFCLVCRYLNPLYFSYDVIWQDSSIPFSQIYLIKEISEGLASSVAPQLCNVP